MYVLLSMAKKQSVSLCVYTMCRGLERWSEKGGRLERSLPNS